MSTALITSLLGLAALAVVRIERRQAYATNDLLIARSNARSAVELALRLIADDSDWRTTYDSGIETTPRSLGTGGTGTVSWILEDTDGSLTDADTDLRLRAIGRVGGTVQVVSVSVEKSPQLLKSNTRDEYSSDEVKESKWWAQYILPDLPPGVVSWRVNSVEFSLARSDDAEETLLIKLYLPDGSNMPGASIDTVSVAESDLPRYQAWYAIDFAGHSGLDPTTGLCIALECQSDDDAAKLRYHSSGDPDPNSAMIQGSQDNGWTAYESDKALLFKVYGTYNTLSELGVVDGTWQSAAAP